MTRASVIRPEFRDRFPAELEEGVLYISRKFSTAAHNCCCGCGVKIMTPIKPGRWQLYERNGRVSLRPSIGNWSSACQSHYWISDNRVDWERSYSHAQIAANREVDRRELTEARQRRYQDELGFWGRVWKAIKAWWS